MTDRTQRYRQYAAEKKVPAMIAAPFYVRILWAMGVDVKPGILFKQALFPAFELAIKISLLVTPLSLLVIWPTSRHFYTDSTYFLASIGAITLFALPGSYLAVRSHRQRLSIRCWEDF